MSNFEEKEPVYLIIPVHNRKNLTLGCLEHLTKTGDRQPYHIIVVDDGSTDGTGEDIKAQYPDVILLPGDGDFSRRIGSLKVRIRLTNDVRLLLYLAQRLSSSRFQYLTIINRKCLKKTRYNCSSNLLSR